MTKAAEKKTLHNLEDYKKSGKTPTLNFKYEDEDVFYKDSPVSKEKVLELDTYSKKYVEDNLKTVSVFAVEAKKEDKELEEVVYDLPYRNDRVKVVCTWDDDKPSMHVEYDVKHMSHSDALKQRNKALKQAMSEG